MSDYNSFRDVVQMPDEPVTPNNPECEPEKPKRYTTILLSDLCELQKKAAERDRLVAFVVEQQEANIAQFQRIKHYQKQYDDLRKLCGEMLVELQDANKDWTVGPYWKIIERAKQALGETPASEMLPVERRGAHEYTSTACYHGLHERCRHTCKFCERVCQCSCHQAIGETTK